MPSSTLSGDLAGQTSPPANDDAAVASNKLSGVSSIPPTVGAQVQSTGPGAGVDPNVALHMPAATKTQADLNARNAVVAGSPAVASWVASAPDYHVAAAQDSLPALAKVDEKITGLPGYEHVAGTSAPSPISDIVNAWTSNLAAVKAAQENPELHSGNFFKFLGAQAREEFANIGAAFSPLAVIGEPLARFDAATTSPTDWSSNPAGSGPTTFQQRVQQGRAFNQVAGAFFGGGLGEGEAAASVAGEAGKIGEGVKPINPVLGPDGAPAEFASSREAAIHGLHADLEPGTRPQPYPTANGTFGVDQIPLEGWAKGEAPFPPEGVSPHADAIRTAVANVDVEGVKGIQETVANEGKDLLSQSPATVESFLQSRLPNAVVSIDPDKLLDLAAQGHEPFPAQTAEATRAAVEGTDIQVPLSQYVVATAGKPFADELNAAATFRDGGTSVDAAKEAPAPAQTVVPGPTTPVPPDLTPEESARASVWTAQANEALTSAAKGQFLSPMVKDPAALGMDASQFARYSEGVQNAVQAASNKMQERIYAAIMRERKPDFKTRAQEHSDTIRPQIEGLPAVRATRALSQPGMKLDRDLVSNFYPEPASRLPKSVVKLNGNHPDDAAELLGYPSGAQLVSDLADLHEAVTASGSKNLDAYVKMQADNAGAAQARTEMGYSSDPADVREAASELINSPLLTDFLSSELKALADASGLPFDEAAIKRFAAQRFGEKTVAEALNLRKLESYVYKGGLKAEKALLKGDTALAFIRKQQQFLHHLQLAEAHKFAKVRKADARTWRRVANNPVLANTAQDATNWTKDILATMGMEVRGNPKDLQPPISGFNTLDDFIRAKNAGGAEIINAPVPKLPVPQQTVAAYRGVSAMIKSILKTGRDEKTVQVGAKREELDAQVDAAVASLNRYTRTITERERTDPTLLESIDRARRFVDAWLVRNEQLMRDFGGRDPNSPFFQVVSRRLEAAKGWALDTRTNMAALFRDLSKEVGPGFDKWMKAKLPTEGPHTLVTTSEGDPIFNTNKDILVAALHMGDDVALQKFAEGYRVGDGPSTPAQIESIVHSRMTDQGWKTVQGIWAAFDKLRPEIEKMYFRLTDVHPSMVEPRPFDIPPGGPATPRHISGGYFPVIYDLAKMPKEWLEKLDPTEMLGDMQYVRATPGNGYIKERTGVAAPIQRNFNLIHFRINQVIHDLAYREALLDINKFLTHPRVSAAIARKYGPEYVSKIKRDLHAIAGAESIDVNENAAVSAAVDWLTEGQMVNMIGFSPTTLMKHFPTAVVQALGEVGPARMAAAYADFMTNHNARVAQAEDESPEIRHIVSMASEDSYKQFLALTEKSGVLDAWRRFAFHTIAMGNRHVALPLYFAAKQMHADQHPELDEDTIRAAANQTVRQALGSSGVTDAPMALRADRSVPGRFYRLQNNFLTFLSHMYNKSREIPQAAGYAGEQVDLARALAMLVTAIVLPSLIDTAVSRLFKKGTNVFASWAEGLIHQTTAPVPGLNTAVAAGMHIADRDYPDADSPTASFGESLGTNVKDIETLVRTHQLHDEMLRHALVTGGFITKTPGLEASRLLGFLNQLREGKEQSKPLDRQIKDLIYGPNESAAATRTSRHGRSAR